MARSLVYVPGEFSCSRASVGQTELSKEIACEVSAVVGTEDVGVLEASG